MVNPQSPRKIAGDCCATFFVAAIVLILAGSVLLNGLAETINAFGSAARWMFGR